MNPITNTAVISQIDLRRDLVNLLQLDFPKAFLPSFLHEGTHHSCFHSPVGTTLALLRMRAYRRATGLRAKTTREREWDLLEDVLRQEATMEVLRPISEGLACFAELDSIPGKSDVLTVPMKSAFFNFGGVENDFKSQSSLADHGADLFLFSLLYHMRLSEQASLRREAVLNAPFKSTSGGHLAGYMGLKVIWMAARRKSDLAWDAELFCAYLRSYFFDDLGFVAIILDLNVIEHDAANAIAHYVFDRVRQLLDLDWESALQKYVRANGAVAVHQGVTQQRRYPAPGGLENDRNLHQLGLSRLEALLAEVECDNRTDELDCTMRRFDFERLQRRELLCLGSLDAKVVVNEFGRVLAYPLNDGAAAEWPVFACGARSGVESGEGNGSLEFYLIPAENSRALVVIREREVVHVRFEGPIGEARQQQLTAIFGTRSGDLHVLEEQEKNLERVIADSAIRFVRTQARSTIPEGVDQFYSMLATIEVPRVLHVQVSEMLLTGGLLGPCADDEEFLHGLAFLGVAATVTSGKAELRDLADHLEIDVDAICLKADAIKSTTGLMTIIERGDEILVVI